jgi:hypothetical protein
LLFFPRFQLSAIFGRKNLRLLQIFVGVNVLGFFLLVFFSGLFLPGGLSNILS